MEIGQLIIKTPGACGGRARLAGRRIPVCSVYRWFLSGFGPEDILKKYDGPTLAEIYAAIAYALANRDEIAAEVEQEDRLESEARERAKRAAVVPA
jgi:type III restriction enzyme